MNQNNNWRLLLARSIRPTRSVLSIYLNVDQTVQDNLNRGFERQFKDLMLSLRKTILDPLELDRFRNAEHHLADFLRGYEVAARTLAMFFDESDGFFWHQSLEIPMQDLARWDRDLFLKPLAAASEDFERYSVALVDRATARLFNVFLGQIEEVGREKFDPMKVRHIKSIGLGHGGTASQVQKKADEQVRRNLRYTVRELDSYVQLHHVNRLMLAGSPESTSALRDLLPKRLSLTVIGELRMDGNASLKDILEATQNLAEAYERDAEQQIVKEVATSAAKTRKAVVGLGNTLKKVNENRVWQLIYSEDFRCPGFECTKCGALFSIERPSCFYCGEPIADVQDVVERAVEHALRNDAKIEIVRREAATSLDSLGGIGAFLKARTRAVEV
jgi:peptide subunit release factor 1 (eRF1)